MVAMCLLLSYMQTKHACHHLALKRAIQLLLVLQTSLLRCETVVDMGVELLDSFQ